MTEHPILFSGPMVRAILDGRKTQTRRVVKFGTRPDGNTNNEPPLNACPYGQPGDRLWVRETFATIKWPAREPTPYGHTDVTYRATANPAVKVDRWRPSIHMPRKFCRLILEVKAVRVERLQDISISDAIAEGVEEMARLVKNQHEYYWVNDHTIDCTYAGGFGCLWDSLNAKRGYGWNENPWVWVIEFEVINKEDRDA